MRRSWADCQPRWARAKKPAADGRKSLIRFRQETPVIWHQSGVVILVLFGGLSISLGLVSPSTQPAELKPPERVKPLERKARHELERRAGRDFTDEEWRAMQAKLKEFYSILSEWKERSVNQRKAD
jgi:hypothetical protein